MKEKINSGLWVTGTLTAVITCIMNFVLMPRIESTTGGIRCFDMNSFGYDLETAQRFLNLISEEGRSIYLHIQLPLDFVYPVIYTVFFILLFVKLKTKAKAVYAIPPLLFISDYIENIFSVIMLKTDELSAKTAGLASGITVTKSILMYACFLIAAVLLVRFLLTKRKGKAM